jgi:hypothetical protein
VFDGGLRKSGVRREIGGAAACFLQQSGVLNWSRAVELSGAQGEKLKCRSSCLQKQNPGASAPGSEIIVYLNQCLSQSVLISSLFI